LAGRRFVGTAAAGESFACHTVGIERNAMHDHLWRDNWIEFKARVMAQWEHLTHHELDAAADKREHVLRHIELREGVDRAEAERRLREVETKR
jgi:hypothetical protein